ncbi:hypothetical protein ACRBU7_11030 [Priestia aryabhattai]|uniref:hypothetical protein n=1 Tax=Priestia aryabhattai TaxID=412384 RepID=UPI003D7FF26D
MEILNNFNVCLAFQYKGLKNFNMEIFQKKFLQNLNSTEFIFYSRSLKSNPMKVNKTLKQTRHFKIYYDDKKQIVIGKNICYIFLRTFEQLESLEGEENSWLNSSGRINLIDKNKIDSYLENVTDNLLEITLSKENYFDYFDTYFFYGSRLQLSHEFDTIINNEDLCIKQLKFQLYDNSTVTIRRENLIEFGSETTVNEKMNFIWFLSTLLLCDT